MSDIIVFDKITKRFPGTVALDGVEFSILRGEIHALVGANGAGKSTLMNILGGTIQPDDGYLKIDGKAVLLKDPHHARNIGISVVYQELRLCDNLTIAENIVLGREHTHGLGAVDSKFALKETQRALAMISCPLDPDAKVSSLSISQKQLVEIARAIANESRILILDEPTSSLTLNETTVLFDNLRLLKDRGVTIIFVSHRLEEIFEICDRISVLRDGRYLSTMDVKVATKEKVVELIAGRYLAASVNKMADKSSAPTIVQVKNLGRGKHFRGISFELKEGEILGIFSLQGAGRTELLESLFGINPADTGSITVRGKEEVIRNPQDAISLGIGMVPEDRRRVGLFLSMDIVENICISSTRSVSRGKLLSGKLSFELANRFVEKIGIKVSSLFQKVSGLSGGNQQKVVLSRWLALEPSVLLLDEVTRGIDVGSKAEIYANLKSLRNEGLSIILVSSELEEIVVECDRILVMKQGSLVDEFSGKDVSAEKVLASAMGLNSSGLKPLIQKGACYD